MSKPRQFTDTQKLCRRCNTWKLFSEFYKNKNNLNDGYSTYCKTCERIRTKGNWKSENSQSGALKRLYGISLEERREMMKKQNNKCVICKKVKRLVTDHNHQTKKVRGLICQGCNILIGFLETRKELLLEVNNYLK